MKPDQDTQLIEILKATGEIYGKTVSAVAATLFLMDLSEYDSEQVKLALSSCRRELKFFPTVSDVVSRIQALDGRPGPEEAWALLPKTERDSAVITDEMAACLIFVNPDDLVASRMAFLEAYRAECKKAREARLPARWFLSGGHDPAGRAEALQLAVTRGRLDATHAQMILPEAAQIQPTGRALALVRNTTRNLLDEK